MENTNKYCIQFCLTTKASHQQEINGEKNKILKIHYDNVINFIWLLSGYANKCYFR